MVHALDYAGPKTRPWRKPWKRPVLPNGAGTLILAGLAFLHIGAPLHEETIMRAWLYAAGATVALTQVTNAKRWFKWVYPPTMVFFISLMFGVSECPHQRVVWFGTTQLSVTQISGVGPCRNPPRASHPLLWDRRVHPPPPRRTRDG